jgi:ABC-type transport system involved in multi-copper enzyme maturation permease subunit
MNRGLLEKTLRETWLPSAIFGLAAFLIAMLLGYVLPTFERQIAGSWLQVALVRNLLGALLGAELGEKLEGELGAAVGPEMLLALPWVHPAVLALLWAHAITLGTRVPAGEIDRGTVDVLLGLPVSRLEVYLAEAAAWLLAIGAVVLALVLGNLAGTRLAGAGFPDPVRLGAVLGNLFALELAVGGIAFLASSLADRRARATGWVFALVLASFLLNFLAQLWEPAADLHFLSLLSYYRPVRVLAEGAWPLADTAVLAALGALLWTLGAAVFARRDIRTL